MEDNKNVKPVQAEEVKNEVTLEETELTEEELEAIAGGRVLIDVITDK